MGALDKKEKGSPIPALKAAAYILAEAAIKLRKHAKGKHARKLRELADELEGRAELAVECEGPTCKL